MSSDTIFGADGTLFNQYADAAVARNAQAMMALCEATGILPTSGATAFQVISAAMEILPARQLSELASLLAASFIASVPGDLSIDGAKFASIVASAGMRPRIHNQEPSDSNRARDSSTP